MTMEMLLIQTGDDLKKLIVVLVVFVTSFVNLSKNGKMNVRISNLYS